MVLHIFVNVSFETSRNIMTEIDLKLSCKKADKPNHWLCMILRAITSIISNPVNNYK